MKIKRAILSVLGRDALKGMIDDLEIDGADRRSVDSMRKALSRSRRATPEYLAEYLYEQDAKQVCEALGMSTKGRRKTLIARLLDKEAGPADGKPGRQTKKSVPKGTRIMATERRADSYDHPEATNLMRPDVGTQAQFRKKKPPAKYRYDSSLSPAMDWDGQNSARELGQWLLAMIDEASRLESPHTFDEPRELKGADGKPLATVRGLQDAVEQFKRISKPFLDWSGKAERQSFDVPTLPLFVHERFSTEAIILHFGRSPAKC